MHTIDDTNYGLLRGSNKSENNATFELLKISLLSLYFFLGLYQGVTLNRGNLEGTPSKECTTTSDLES